MKRLIFLDFIIGKHILYSFIAVSFYYLVTFTSS